MKKTLAITALVSVIGLTGITSASAWQGGMKGHRGCNGPGYGMRITADMDEATKAKFVAFRKDTEDLRKNIAVKRAQKRALMKTSEPDVEKVGQLAGELFDLRSSMREKAESAGVSDIIAQNRACGKGDGPGSRHGRRGMLKRKGNPSGGQGGDFN